MNILLGVGAGFFVKWLAPIIAKKAGEVLIPAMEVFRDNIKNLDNLLEEKSGIDLFSSGAQDKYDALVNHVVEFVEAAVTDQAKIRFVLNALLRGKTPVNKELLADWAGKSWREFLASMPEELKPIISEAKENLAVNMIEKLFARLTDTAAPPREVIKASIAGVVAAKNANQATVERAIGEESFSGLFERLCEESKARQEALKK